MGNDLFSLIMITIHNKFIPFKGFISLALWPFIFVRKDMVKVYNDGIERHEKIHGEQQKEMLMIFFLLWYGIEWLIRYAKYRNRITSYKNISFEQEAYDNAHDITYLDERKHYVWLKYFITNKK